tara:strand:+ start:4252 stop:5469 length:1218 start_codon:yes stop_codon:yes gene_type:complete
MPIYVARIPKKPHVGYYFESPPLEKGYIDESQQTFSRVRWKTSCFANKIRYIGNVYVTIKGDENVETSQRLPDSVFKSDPGQYDSFRPYRRIDVATGDGEDIVALEVFADRLLQFKQNTLTIINIQGDAEFIEDVFKYKGIESSQAVIRTDFGVAWVNEQGVYLYNGQGGVNNLLERNGQRVISMSTDTLPSSVTGTPWDSFVTKQSCIGYSPLHRKLFVRKKIGGGTAATNSADLYIFDIASGSWSFHKANATDDPVADCSGYFVDQNKDLVFFEEVTANATLNIKKYNPAPAPVAEFSFWTKNYDMGDPYIPKTIYKVAIRCKNGSSVPVFVSTDGGQTQTSIGDLGASVNASGWIELSTNMPMAAVHQIMVGFNTGNAVTVDSDFELYEINIVYRRLKVKSL